MNVCVFAQQGSKVEIVSSQLLKGFTGEGLMRIIKPVFSQEGTTLSADSANFNQSANTFDAFGHVVITQPNGNVIYSDLLNYNGNTRLARLTRNVRMVDGDATLTTGLLTYNVGTRMGTYTGGGKIVNGENVLTSKNGYYFANSRDSYFRHNVVVTSPEAVIKSDTLRYNTGSKIAYFYGPTNIYGKDDTLYTENGQYNTLTDQARFGKNNLYTQGSKSLKGDSLFYDRKAGFGRAVKNITFIDTEQKVILKGDLGVYRKADESTLVTQNAYVVMTTESDSAKTDSIWMAADTLYTQLIPMKDIKPIQRPELKKDTELEDPAVTGPKGMEGPESRRPAEENADETLPRNQPPGADTTKMDTLPVIPPATTKTDTIPVKPTAKVENADSLRVVADTVKEKADETLPRKRSNKPKKLKRDRARNKRDNKLPSSADTTRMDTLPIKPGRADTLKSTLQSDSLSRDTLNNKLSNEIETDSLSQDTSKTRIVLAYGNVKVFKSDLQARADSIFYSYSDSTMRCYVNPMVWAQGSQMSADTIYMQLKNNKLDNMLLLHDGFIVNTEADSTNFNQVKGKVMTGYFRDSKLERMFVDGNAESIYYQDTGEGMNKSVSSRIKLFFADNKPRDIYFIKKVEMTFIPIEKVDAETNILEGFVWKPKDRPRSKEEIIPSAAKTKPKVKTTPKKPVAKVPPETSGDVGGPE